MEGDGLGMTTGEMQNTLTAEPRVPFGTIPELERKIAAYEIVYGMTTDEFLARYTDPTDSLADVEDAELWFERYSTLCRMREEGPAPPQWVADEPENSFEGLKEPSNQFYESCFLRDYRVANHRSSKDAIPRDHGIGLAAIRQRAQRPLQERTGGDTRTHWLHASREARIPGNSN